MRTTRDTWSWSDVLPAGSFSDYHPPKKPRKKRGPGRHRNPLREVAVHLVRNGRTYSEVAHELGLTRNQVAGFMFRENGARE